MQLTARNTDLDQLHTILTEQHGRKADYVLDATDLRVQPDGTVTITGMEIDEDGVTDRSGTFKASDIAVGHLAEQFGIDTRYLRKVFAARPDIFAANVNGWIHGDPSGHWIDGLSPADPDKRRFLFRGFTGDGDHGIMRGLLSSKYGLIDNLDVLMAALDGVRAAGVAVQIDSCDLSERNMYVRVMAPEVKAMAPALFENYRSPFAGGTEVRVGGGGWTPEQARAAAAREGLGYEPGKEPILFAGFEIGNSELGNGAFTVTPRAVAEICGNGLKITADAERAVHVGARMEKGVIDWSAETRQRALALIKSKTADAVRTFVSAEYWSNKVAELEGKAVKPVTDPDATIKSVGKTLKYTEAEQQSILRHFLMGGQMTAGGVMNAVTSVAQTVNNPDTAADLEASAIRVLDLV